MITINCAPNLSLSSSNLRSVLSVIILLSQKIFVRDMVWLVAPADELWRHAFHINSSLSFYANLLSFKALNNNFKIVLKIIFILIFPSHLKNLFYVFSINSRYISQIFSEPLPYYIFFCNIQHVVWPIFDIFSGIWSSWRFCQLYVLRPSALLLLWWISFNVNKS